MDFLQRNPCKLANYLYNVENFLVLLRIQLNFYIIERKLAKNERKLKEIQDCVYAGANLVTG